MLSHVNYGKFNVQTELLFGESIFLSKIMLNSEVWHSLTKVQIEDLETGSIYKEYRLGYSYH